MTQPIVMAKDSLLRLNGNRLSDHNRAELSVDNERIETAKRMADGTLRKYVVADKRTFAVSWTDIPNDSTNTVDGFWGGQEMEDFFRANTGSVTLSITSGNGVTTTHTCVISQFNRSLKKRGMYDFWDVSLELEEV